MNDVQATADRLASQLLQRLEWRPGQLPSQPIALVSGGADSVFLLFALLGLSQQGLCRRPVILHVDHRLRDDSGDCARFVMQLAGALDLSVYLHSVDVARFANRSGANIEAAGRTLRYRALRRLARQNDGAFGCSGHHADDYVESLLLHLIRGGGPGALSTMDHWAEMEGVALWRPLLVFRGAEIRSALAAEGLDWREDESNHDLAFQRNLIRRRITPLLEDAGLDPLRLWRNFHELPSWSQTIDRPQWLCIDRQLWAGASPAAMKTILDPCLRRLMLPPLDRAAAFELAGQAAGGRRARIRYLRPEWRIWCDQRSPLWLFRNDAPCLRPARWRFWSGHTRIQYNGQEAAAPAALSPALFAPGMRVADGNNKLKRVFQDRSLPAPLRSCIPLLVNPHSGRVHRVLLSMAGVGPDWRFERKTLKEA